MEIESALVDHHKVAEAAVIGKSHDIKGQCIVAFITLKEGVEPTCELQEQLRLHVAQKSVLSPNRKKFTSQPTCQKQEAVK